MNKASGVSFYIPEKDTMTNPLHSSIHSLQHISLPACVQPYTEFLTQLEVSVRYASHLSLLDGNEI